MRSWSRNHRGRLLAIAGLFAIAIGLNQALRVSPARAGEGAGASAQTEELASVEAISKAFRTVVKQVSPAVVQIQTTARPKARSARRQQRELPENLPEPLRELFERFGEQGLEMPDPRPRSGSGSGVIIDAKAGLILTNNHVAGNPEDSDDDIEMRVSLQNGEHYEGAVVGTDPKTDIALIRIEAEGLQEAPLGNSDAMEVGDWVLAVGAPFGLAQTVTQGIISAKGRQVKIVRGYEDFLQTDAAINPGNSGGPLVNMRGEVIGINTAIATSGLVSAYMGVGFAIPSNMAKEVLPYLREGKEVVRGYLGVEIQDLAASEPGFEETFGLESRDGVYIQDVFADRNTPAAKAGLRPDDVVLECDGEKTETADELQDLVARTDPGTTVKMKIWRDGKAIIVPVTIGKQPKDFFDWALDRHRGGFAPEPQEEEAKEETVDTLGLTFEPITPELAKQYEWRDFDEVKGTIIVTEVDPLGEAAEKLGIRAGDILCMVNGKRMQSVDDVLAALSKKSLESGVRVTCRKPAGVHRTEYLKVKP